MCEITVEQQSALETLNYRLSSELLSAEVEQEILVEITSIHRELVASCLSSTLQVELDADHISWETLKLIKEKISNEAVPSPHEKSLVEDRCLDLAIAAKRSNEMEQCSIAHMIRMETNQQLACMDAVRLIGYQKNSEGINSFSVTDTQPNAGLFEVNEDGYCTEPAEDTAERIRDFFNKANFTNSACRLYMKSVIPGCSPDRLFDANCFFQHRWELNGKIQTSLDVLVRLFLFGVALEQDVIMSVLGQESWDLLRETSLLFQHPSSTSLFIGQVQIYPISPSDLAALDSECCWFITDWPMESLRPTRNAIMPIGYDTLELMSLSAVGGSGAGLLDLCCGCGVQGIFAYIAGQYDELVCTDINHRASRYVAANFCLNEVHGRILKGDLFHEGLRKERFSRIVSNPPFVALPRPLQSINTQPSLYSIAGVNGTDILQRIVAESHDYLRSNGKLLMVTEVPNIEDSCDLLTSYSEKRFHIGVAYVGADVEEVEVYGQARENEVSETLHQNERWCMEQEEMSIRNRALALIAMKPVDNSGGSVYQFDPSVPKSNDSEEQDEEDAFLTKQGIHFTRSNLIFNS